MPGKNGAQILERRQNKAGGNFFRPYFKEHFVVHFLFSRIGLGAMSAVSHAGVKRGKGTVAFGKIFYLH